jgi:hypothetical protein
MLPTLVLRRLEIPVSSEHFPAPSVVRAVSHVCVRVVATVSEAVRAKATAAAMTSQRKAAFKAQKGGSTPWALQRQNPLLDVPAGLFNVAILSRSRSKRASNSCSISCTKRCSSSLRLQSR